MVYTFRIISHEEESFVRDFCIRTDQTFFDFHMAIQDELGYDKSQMASFFLANEEWEKEKEITLFEMSDDRSKEYLVMDKVRIGQAVTELKQKILYVFDFFSDRCFYAELIKKDKEDPSATYPVCVRAKGRVPIQIIMEDNNIDMFNSDEFEEFDGLNDDITFESIDDYEEF
ncbi:MAG: hypothetical protein JSV24_02550 [Bacteroidales bacterium]|nr:MAG: hypothetical protein JSV24_02550 [Bacteroidales bacterium]